MTSDLTPDDLAAIASAEAGEAVAEAVDPDPPSRWKDAPLTRVWPVTPEDYVVHAAALAVYLAERAVDAEAEQP